MGFFSALVRSWTRPDAVAIEWSGTPIRYGELRERVARAAGFLKERGLGPGDVVAIGLERDPAIVELHLGALATGVRALPTNERYTGSEIAYLVEDSGAKLAALADGLTAPCEVVSQSGLRAALDASPAVPLPDRPDDEVAVIGYTSGTTGKPKGALLTHRNLIATVSALHEAWRWSDDDVLVHALPLFHIHGLFVAQYGALWAGARTRWMPRFEPGEVLEALEADGTLFMGVPTFYQRFVELPRDRRWDLSRVRLFTSGSAALPPHVFRAFEQRFGHRILERYGMTEIGIVLSNPYDDRRPGSVGRPLRGVEARVVDSTTGNECPDGEVGELRIRGESVFAGYLNRASSDAFDADRFMRTGDLALVDDGHIRLVGRSRDLVICGGFNVYPPEIEAVLAEHPDVAEVAVVGVVDVDLGERIVATVVPRSGSTPTEADLRAFAAERLTGYKQPKRVRFVDALPRNAMGKIQKDVLRRDWERPVVRDAHLEEAPTIAHANVEMALETEGIALDPATVEAGTRAVFDRDVGARFFVAEIAGSYAGQCMVTTEWSDWRNRPVWWIQSVYVHPGLRKRGVYRALHDAVLDRAREAGAGGVRLYVDRRNTAAADVYRSVGMNGDHYLVFEAMFEEPPKAEDSPHG